MDGSRTTPDGGPAFPVIGAQAAPEDYPGMTLRDYFAGQALTMGGEFFHNLGNGCDTPKTIAEAAYQIADEMLKARGA